MSARKQNITAPGAHALEPDTFVLSDHVVAPAIAVDRNRLAIAIEAIVAARIQLARGRHVKCDEALDAAERMLRETLDERPRSPDPYPPCDVA